MNVAMPSDKSPTCRRFIIDLGNRKYELEAETHQDMVDWINCLSHNRKLPVEPWKAYPIPGIDFPLPHEIKRIPEAVSEEELYLLRLVGADTNVVAGSPAAAAAALLAATDPSLMTPAPSTSPSSSLSISSSTSSSLTVPTTVVSGSITGSGDGTTRQRLPSKKLTKMLDLANIGKPSATPSSSLATTTTNATTATSATTSSEGNGDEPLPSGSRKPLRIMGGAPSPTTRGVNVSSATAPVNVTNPAPAPSAAGGVHGGSAVIVPSLPPRNVVAHAIFDFAQTGDLVLFQTKKGPVGGMIRGLTRSIYDHIGVLVRGPKGELFVMESVGERGVTSTDMAVFIGNSFNEHYRRIAIRRLLAPESVLIDMRTQMLSFIRTVLGRKYGINPRKLMVCTHIFPCPVTWHLCYLICFCDSHVAYPI
jgi:hypothetical protein